MSSRHDQFQVTSKLVLRTALLSLPMATRVAACVPTRWGLREFGYHSIYTYRRSRW
jgi:hypothetical protein